MGDWTEDVRGDGELRSDVEGGRGEVMPRLWH